MALNEIVRQARSAPKHGPMTVGMPRLATLIAAFSLASCSANSPTPQQTLEHIEKISIVDLQAAQVDALKHKDILAATCYPALAQWVSQLSINQQPPVGAFSAFQAARDVYKSSSGGFPDYVKLNCAAFFLDVKSDMTQLIATIARIAAGTYIPPILFP